MKWITRRHDVSVDVASEFVQRAMQDNGDGGIRRRRQRDRKVQQATRHGEDDERREGKNDADVEGTARRVGDNKGDNKTDNGEGEARCENREGRCGVAGGLAIGIRQNEDF